MKKYVLLLCCFWIIQLTVYCQSNDSIQVEQLYEDYSFVGRLYGKPTEIDWRKDSRYYGGAYGWIKPEYFVRQLYDEDYCMDYIEIDSASYDSLRTDQFLYKRLEIFVQPESENFIVNQGDRKNALSCKLMLLRNDTLEFDPYKLSAYRVDCRTYEAKDLYIDGIPKRYFLELITKDDSISFTRIYYMKRKKKHFYLEKNDTLIELEKNKQSDNNYKKVLQEKFDDCQYTNHNLLSTRFNKTSLRNFVEGTVTCKDIYKPIRIGVSLGMGTATYTYLEPVLGDKLKYNNLLMGVFVDIPLSNGPFSLYTELFYLFESDKSKKHTYNQEKNRDRFKMVIFPVMFRYYFFNTRRIRPYVNGGFSYIFLPKEKNIFWREVNDLEGKKNLNPCRFSVIGGGGVFLKIQKRTAVFVEYKTQIDVKFGASNHNFFTGFSYAL